MIDRDRLVILIGAPLLLFACKLGSLFGGSDEGGSSTGAPSPPSTGGATLPGAAAGGRSAVPSVGEWGSAPEVTVRGSSALGCSTKVLREWFRVSCSGTNDSGGKPTTVAVTRGGNAERYTFAQNNVTSLVTPFVEGSDFEALFSWTDKSAKLVVKWPRGAPRPGTVGVFEGAGAAPAKPAGQACRAHTDCGAGKKCCASPVGATCAPSCDPNNAPPVCTADAECAGLMAIPLKCKPHPSGVKACLP